MTPDDEDRELLRQVEARCDELEARAAQVATLRRLLEVVRRRRRLAQRRGVRVMEHELADAARTVVTASGCAAVIAGASALDAAWGAPALVLAFVLLVVEGSR